METNYPDPQQTVARVFALYEKHGNEDYIGEPVSQLEHMSQAAVLAKREGFEEEVVLAAFFHDIGHLCADEQAERMNSLGNVDHEKLGAKYLLENGFSERMARLVESHVIAKRYLTYKHPEYYDQLSDASKQTLEFQGGRMSAQEAAGFEQDPDAGLFIRLRHWDDKAKETNIPIQNLDELKAMTLNHLIQQRQ
jgi:phosphonate degradation associated HDIG domain protein